MPGGPGPLQRLVMPRRRTTPSTNNGRKLSLPPASILLRTSIHLGRQLQPLHAGRRLVFAERERDRFDRAGEREQALLLVVVAYGRYTVHSDVHRLGAASLGHLHLDTNLADLL